MDGEYLVCKNDECPAQISGAVKRWVKGLNLKGWGDEIIDTLCEQGIVKDAADLYTLDAKGLADVQMHGRRVGGTADTILKELHAKKDIPIHVLVGSLNIPTCGVTMGKMAADAGFDTLSKMQAAKLTEIAAIPGFGVTKAEAFVKGIAERTGLIVRLLTNGVTVRAPVVGSLSGKTFCMTGFRDSSLASALEAAGGAIKSGVSKNLTYLICLDKNSASGKAQKAREYGTCVIDVDEAWGLVR
jgi:DNA ligase (NAD+)